MRTRVLWRFSDVVMFEEWIRFWVRRDFRAHRVVGLLYLFNWVDMARLMLAVERDTFVSDPYYGCRMCALLCHGLIQTGVAFRSFRFLSRKDKQNYFSDRGTISRAFVAENAFFVIVSIYASVQNTPCLAEWTKGTAVELAFVFFPYHAIRPFFPKTSFVQKRSSDQEIRNDTTMEKNARLMQTSAYVTKVAYILGKHMLGYFVNYVAFVRGLTSWHRWLSYAVMLGGGYNLTIGVFIHTLKFKKIISPLVAILLYIPPFVIWAVPGTLLVSELAVENRVLFTLSVIGMLANVRMSSGHQAVFQFAMLAVCRAIQTASDRH